MSNNINHQKLEAYSRALAEKLSTGFFTKKSVATGDDILHFTPIEQINLFIVKIVFDKWKEENEKLRSPYFDYENGEVKEALGNLMVQLSKHIAIRKEHFDNLLNKAIRDTLFIMTDPVFFLRAEYFSKSSTQIEELKDREKYIKINKFLLHELIGCLEKENKKYVNIIGVGDLLENVFNEHKDRVEDTHLHIAAFSALLPLQESDLFNNIVQKSQPVVPVVEVKPRTEPVTPAKQFTQNESILNDKLKNPETSLFEKHSKAKIEDIRTAISLAQKFLFINALFKGDALLYNKALDAINTSQDLRNATNMLYSDYASKLGWDSEKDEVKEFYEIVERKF
jgi:hypothetical protein